MSGSCAAPTGLETDGAAAAGAGGEAEQGEGGAGDGGENGCWITTQDVCPWEDDSLTPTWLWRVCVVPYGRESCKKESHPPFVKTYATLGYL
jgi:hypothetical protein